MPPVCFNADQLTDACMNLLPRGRAWPRRRGTTLWKFWRATGEALAFWHGRLCALYYEFFCGTVSETLDWWLVEYGLPDACDPFPNLCEKVTSVIDPRCDVYAAIAARHGWSIACVQPCAGEAACMEAGMVGGIGVAPRVMLVAVYLASSPAYSGVEQIGPVAGYLEAGMPIACGPDISSLDCLMQRIVQADIQINYILV